MSEDLTILRGDGTWPWSAHVDGDDIIVPNARATCFGGGNDPQDDGQTASGVSTKLNPNLAACSLPMIYTGRDPKLIKALGGSPIPRVPWRTLVEVTEVATGRKFAFPVIDIGPGKRTGNALDLTIAAARKFKSAATADCFALVCNYRIIGGAKFLKGKGSLL